MNICLLSREYPWRHPFGGVGVSMANLARALARNGESVAVITRSPTEDVETHDEPNLHVKGLPLGSCPFLPERLARFSAVETAAWSRIAAREILTGELGPFDIVEAAEGGGEALSLLKHPRHPPTVVRICGGASLGLQVRGLYRWYHYPVYRRERRSLLMADRVAALTVQAWQENKRHFRLALDDVAIHPNTLDTDEFRPAREPPAAPITILFVGRMDAVKGFDLMPAIVGSVLAEAPQVCFRFVGADRRVSREIPETSKDFLLSRLSPGQGKNITFAANLPIEAMPEAYRAAHVLLAPSRTEAASRVCAEAAACGLPAVGSRGTGMESIIVAGETGYLETVGDAAAFARRIVELARDGEKRRVMGQSARQHAVSTFSYEVVAERTVSFYRESIARGRRDP